MQLLLSLYIPHLPTPALQVLYKLLIRIGPWGELVATSSLAGGTKLSHSLPLPPQGPLGMLRAGAWGVGGWSCTDVCLLFPPPRGVNPAPDFTFLCDGKCDGTSPCCSPPCPGWAPGAAGAWPLLVEGCWVPAAGEAVGSQEPLLGLHGDRPPLGWSNLQLCAAALPGVPGWWLWAGL